MTLLFLPRNLIISAIILHEVNWLMGKCQWVNWLMGNWLIHAVSLDPCDMLQTCQVDWGACPTSFPAGSLIHEPLKCVPSPHLS